MGLVEQPVAAWNYEGLREIRQAVRLPIAADESCHTPVDAARLASMQAVDFINIKLMKCGGIYNALKINAVAESFGVSCMIGCMEKALWPMWQACMWPPPWTISKRWIWMPYTFCPTKKPTEVLNIKEDAQSLQISPVSA